MPDREKALAHLDEMIKTVRAAGINHEPRFAHAGDDQRMFTAEELKAKIMLDDPLAPEIIRTWSMTHEEIEDERSKAKARLCSTRL